MCDAISFQLHNLLIFFAVVGNNFDVTNCCVYSFRRQIVVGLCLLPVFTNAVAVYHLVVKRAIAFLFFQKETTNLSYICLYAKQFLHFLIVVFISFFLYQLSNCGQLCQQTA